MDAADKYHTIKAKSEGLFKDRGSKFIGLAFRVQSVEDVSQVLETVKKDYRDARHHCYAYKIGLDDNNWRVNDDGEPGGSAGKPIMGQISSFNLTNIMIVVVRYFGGTLLGVGGLVNAYRSAAKDALQNATIISELIMVSLEINFPYSAMNEVMSLIKDEGIKQTHQDFDLQCSMRISFRMSLKERIESKLDIIKGVGYKQI